MADFRQIRQIRQIFFPPKFLPLRYVKIESRESNDVKEATHHALAFPCLVIATGPMARKAPKGWGKRSLSIDLDLQTRHVMAQNNRL